jgi:F0F1-type ATP synthase assembly protein I
MDLDTNAARFIAVGMEFAATVVAGVISGYYLDTWLGTAPLFTLLLTLGGMGGALYRLIWNLKPSRSVSDLEARSDQRERTIEKTPARPPEASGVRAAGPDHDD